MSITSRTGEISDKSQLRSHMQIGSKINKYDLPSNGHHGSHQPTEKSLHQGELSACTFLGYPLQFVKTLFNRGKLGSQFLNAVARLYQGSLNTRETFFCMLSPSEESLDGLAQRADDFGLGWARHLTCPLAAH